MKKTCKLVPLGDSEIFSELGSSIIYGQHRVSQTKLLLLLLLLIQKSTHKRIIKMLLPSLTHKSSIFNLSLQMGGSFLPFSIFILSPLLSYLPWLPFCNSSFLFVCSIFSSPSLLLQMKMKFQRYSHLKIHLSYHITLLCAAKK